MTRLSTKLVAGVGIIALAGACVRGDPVSPAGNEEGNAWLFTGSATNPSPVLPNGVADTRISLEVDDFRQVEAVDEIARFKTEFAVDDLVAG